MKKISLLLLLLGLLGLISLCIYTGISLSRIMPLLSLYTLFIYVFLSGLICRLSTYGTDNITKWLSFSFLITSFLATIASSLNLIVFDASIKIQTSLIMISVILMVSSFYKGYLKVFVLSSTFFPILLLLGIRNNSLASTGTIYFSFIFLTTLFKTLIHVNKKKAL